MNKFIGIGNLTHDPELKTTTTGMAVTNFTIAINGYKEGEVDFINCTTFKAQAENVAKYCHKGSKVGVDGKLQIKQYEKDGVKKYSTSIICNFVEFLSHKEQGNQDNQQYQSNDKQIFQQDTQKKADDFFDNKDISEDSLPF